MVVRTKTKVVHVEDGLVRVETPTGATEEIHAHTVLWAAGVLASSFGRKVAAATGAETDRNGRVRVGRGPHGPGPPGGLRRRRRGGPAVEAGPRHAGRRPGRHPGRLVRGQGRSSRGSRGQPVKPFRYSNHGDVAVIGRLRGVTDIPWMGPFGQQGGFTAWLLWLLIHIAYLIGFANRIVVVTRWAFSFLTRGRSTRLITGQPLVPPIEAPLPVDPSAPPLELPDDGAATRQRRASEASHGGARDSPANPTRPPSGIVPVSDWAAFAAGDPGLADAGRRLLERIGHGSGLLATVRGDAPPRISPVSVAIKGGRLLLYVIVDSAKDLDLLADGRYALHAHQDPAVPPRVPGPRPGGRGRRPGPARGRGERLGLRDRRHLPAVRAGRRARAARRAGVRRRLAAGLPLLEGTDGSGLTVRVR